MITDPSNGNVVSFIPINLTEGEESDSLTLRIAPEVEEGLLRGRLDPAAAVWARIAPAAWQAIGVTPIDLSSFFGSSVDVDFKIVAASPLPGVTRVLIGAGISRVSAAAWLL